MATPTITSFSPATVEANAPAAGTTTTITGTNFDSANVTAVTVNGKAAAFSITNGTTLVVTVPNAEVGVATVTVTNPTATATATTGLTITGPIVPATATYSHPTGVFDTSGTSIFTVPTIDQYKGLNAALFSTADSGYALYLQKLAKIVAVRLYNTRYSPDLSVPTF